VTTMTHEQQPPSSDEERFPPMSPRDKLVLVSVFAFAILGVVGVVAFWDRFLAVVKR
jgi:hypothetical protein